MAAITINTADVFPDGTSVSAYQRNADIIDGAPSGTAVATATATSGTVSFSGLADNTGYVAYANVAGQDRFRRFYTGVPASSGSSGPGYKGDWAASTAYKSGEIVTAPTGGLVAARADFTSGATFDPGNWRPLAASEVVDVRSFGAKCDARRISDAGMATGATPNLLNSATAAFTSADVGKRAYVYGASAGANLIATTITAVNSATQAVLGANAGTTVTNAEAYIGTDDSTAINAAIQSGAAVVFIPASTIVHSTIMLKQNVVLRGAGSHSDPAVQAFTPGPNGLLAQTTLIGLGASGSFVAIDTPQGIRNFAVERMAIICRKGGQTNDHRTAGGIGIRINNSCVNWHLSDIDGAFASNGIVVNPAAQMAYLDNVHWREARNHNLALVGMCNQITTRGGCLFQVADSFGVATAGTNPANVALMTSGGFGPYNVKFDHRLWDETGLAANHSCLYADSGDNIAVDASNMYPPTGGYGIYIGAACKRWKVSVARIEPYNRDGKFGPASTPPDRVPAFNIFVDPAASDIVLQDINTLSGEGGGDISDTGLRATLRNVNGVSRSPAAGSTQLKVLTADVGPITAQTVLQDITGLGLDIGASATEMWLVKYWLDIDAANTAMDLKLGFTFPTGATGRWGVLSTVPTTSASWLSVAAGSTPTALSSLSQTTNVGTNAAVTGLAIVAKVFGGGTAGPVQLQYAQNTSDAGALKIDRGSVMEATRLAA